MTSKLDDLVDVQVAEQVGRQGGGACNAEARRIWLTLELVKKPIHCLEYIIAHELVHLLERHHNDRFTALMDQFMPLWRQYREELNRTPLAHGEWEY